MKWTKVPVPSRECRTADGPGAPAVQTTGDRGEGITVKRTHPRQFITALLSAGLLLAAMVPATSAAPPRWSITSTQLTPGGVSAGGTQGFKVTITNKGPSNIS